MYQKDEARKKKIHKLRQLDLSNTYQGVMAKNKYIAVKEEHFTRKELKNVNNQRKLFDT
jgi:hypothetical protein